MFVKSSSCELHVQQDGNTTVKLTLEESMNSLHSVGLCFIFKHLVKPLTSQETRLILFSGSRSLCGCLY